MMPTWIFDLDNTLHDAGHGIFPVIDRAMTDYIMRHLSMGHAEANALRQFYWRRYGATLKGLVLHHGVNPRHFLRETHPMEELAQWLKLDTGLAPYLRSLPGQKIVLSNGPTHYVEDILDRMGIAHCFRDAFGVERLCYHPKPHKQAYWAVLTRYRLNPAHCIMVEDSLENLRTAKRLGMKTVWVSRALQKPCFVDARITKLPELLRLSLSRVQPPTLDQC